MLYFCNSINHGFTILRTKKAKCVKRMLNKRQKGRNRLESVSECVTWKQNCPVKCSSCNEVQSTSLTFLYVFALYGLVIVFSHNVNQIEIAEKSILIICGEI